MFVAAPTGQTKCLHPKQISSLSPKRCKSASETLLIRFYNPPPNQGSALRPQSLSGWRQVFSHVYNVWKYLQAIANWKPKVVVFTQELCRTIICYVVKFFYARQGLMSFFTTTPATSKVSNLTNLVSIV